MKFLEKPYEEKLSKEEDMAIYLQTDNIQLQPMGKGDASIVKTISAQSLVDILRSKESEISHRITFSTPPPPDRDDFYHEYPFRKPCDKNKEQKCDQLIKVDLKNKKAKTRLELFYTLIEGRTEITAVRVGIRQVIEDFPYPVRVGVVSPRTHSRLLTSKVDLKRQQVTETKNMRLTPSEEINIHDQLERTLKRILEAEKK